jgi:hypothetical protein
LIPKLEILEKGTDRNYERGGRRWLVSSKSKFEKKGDDEERFGKPKAKWVLESKLG